MRQKHGPSSDAPWRQSFLAILALPLPLLAYAAADMLAGPMCTGIRHTAPPTGIVIAWYWFAPAIAPMLGLPGIVLLKRKAFVIQVLLTAAIWAMDIWSCAQLFLA